MLRSLKDIEQYAVMASDGDVGYVENFLLDDEHWTVRYLVVETKSFLHGREVLISPISFRDVEWGPRWFHVGLTTDQMQEQPER